MPLQILFHQSDSVRNCKTLRMKKAINAIATDYGWTDGEISVAIVNDQEIRQVNSQHLAHDYATDVISFDLTEGDELLEGEIIASVETADRVAIEHDWSGDDELLLYVIHGMLHIIGLRDKSPKDVRAMRDAEAYYLASFGL
jgi:probable rRNA maturation factor